MKRFVKVKLSNFVTLFFVLMSIVLVLSSCIVGLPRYGVGSGSVLDYYREHTLSTKDFPFDVQITTVTDRVRFINSEETMESMVEKFDEVSNMSAKIVECVKTGYHDVVRTIVLQVQQYEFKYYFEIYPDSSNVYNYFIEASQESTYFSNVECDHDSMIFLAPSYAIQQVVYSDYRANIALSWNKFVEFYTNTGRDNFEIDYQNKIIIFDCIGYHPFPAAKFVYVPGKINIHFEENERDGNQIWIDRDW
ncbi:MAG: hypothetical protein FWF56_06415 [Firmicutes bacterium]|nr:hypothetical protein [Bacillota bacterium]MCL1953243.1 hypothetical protein [Bacillota bacterium]